MEARPMGFILWVKDGYADCLEGFTVDDSTVGLDLATMNFTLPFVSLDSNRTPD